jgi:hypothetical protein
MSTISSGSSGLTWTSDNSSNLILTSPTINTPIMGGSVITSGTSQASTSGTSIDFTGIPSWAKRITVMFNGVSTNGTTSLLIRLGTSGTPATSGYISTSSYVTTPNGAGSAGGVNSTAGFVIQNGETSYTLYGSIVFTNISGNIWVAQGNFANIAITGLAINAAGSSTLGGILNMVRITTANGTDTFDAGSINILYE